jgi:sugar phosphate isomerase/epimerase
MARTERPRYGMMTKPSSDIIKEIKTTKRMGFDYVELGMEIPQGHYDNYRKNRVGIIKALKAFDNPPLTHTGYWSDLWSDYDEVRNAWIGVFKKSIDVSKMLGCRKMNIHAPIIFGMYKRVNSCKRQALMNAVNSLREIVRHGSRKRIKIVLENMPDPVNMRLEEYSYIVNRVPGLGVHVDVGHSFLEGGMAMVSRYIRTFKDRLEHLHFSDNLGLDDDHIGIGQGIIDYFRVMRLLKRIRYDKTITLEVYSSRRDLRDSLRIIRAIEEEVW